MSRISYICAGYCDLFLASLSCVRVLSRKFIRYSSLQIFQNLSKCFMSLFQISSNLSAELLFRPKSLSSLSISHVGIPIRGFNVRKCDGVKQMLKLISSYTLAVENL